MGAYPKVLSLCSGIGGLDLGIRIACKDARTVCYVEREAYCLAVLLTRMEAKELDEAPIWSDLATFDAKPWRGVVDCVAAGFPCQPVSVSGKRKGSGDERWLWPHVFRIIGECEPSIVFLENVPGLVSLGFEEIVQDLEGLGYKVAAELLTAEEVGASHRRERLFVMAHTNGQCRARWGKSDDMACEKGEAQEISQERQRGRDAADDSFADIPIFPPGPDDENSWRTIPRELHPAISAQSAVRGMADGIPDRLDRLRVLGNGVVPQQAAKAWRLLREKLHDVRDIGTIHGSKPKNF